MSNDDVTLFDPDAPVIEPHARLTDPETSHAATAHVAAGTDREAVLYALYDAPEGLTDFELAAQIGRQQTSAGKRRGDLVKYGYVEYAHTKREAPSGALARVWRITTAGRAAADRLVEEGSDT